MISPYENRSSGYRLAKKANGNNACPGRAARLKTFSRGSGPTFAEATMVPAFLWLSYSPWAFSAHRRV
jgi:hypothetical protein